MPQNEDNTDPAEVYRKRRRAAIWCSVSLFGLSLLVLVIGLLSATRTDNVAVSGYYPGIILSFGSFLGVVGLNLVENRRPMLVASIIFISLGVVSCFLCAIIDGVIAAEFIDKRPLMEGRCNYFSSAKNYGYENYYTEVHCQSYNGNSCKLKVKSNTCYCCDLYHCDSLDYSVQYHDFNGVSSCWDVVCLYRLMWGCVALNVLGVFLGIVTTALLGAFKDLSSANPVSSSPPAPPHILYNPSQQLLTYSGFCPSGQTLPAFPNYPLPLQPLNSFQSPSAGQPTPEVCTSPPEEPRPQTPNPAQQIQTTSPDPSGYMMTPNAPSFYPHTLGPFEKPPPYAC